MKWFSQSRLGAYGAVAALTVLGGGGLVQRCGSTPAPAPVATPATWPCIDQTNAERAAAGLPALAANPALDYAARFHAQFQARRNTMTHTGAGGSNPGQRIAAEGYAAGAWAENVAAGYLDCASVMQGWMNSPGHRANILSGAVSEIGVGVAVAKNGTVYWTMDLAAP